VERPHICPHAGAPRRRAEGIETGHVPKRDPIEVGLEVRAQKARVKERPANGRTEVLSIGEDWQAMPEPA
jgi:hypothetical protein